MASGSGNPAAATRHRSPRMPHDVASIVVVDVLVADLRRAQADRGEDHVGIVAVRLDVVRGKALQHDHSTAVAFVGRVVLLHARDGAT
jgi:hypothetical protein